MRMIHGTVALFAGLALTGCMTSMANNDSSMLAGGEWLVEDIASRGVIDDAQTTLMFGEDGRLNGNTACNGYFADYSTDGMMLDIDNAGATKRACPPAVMDQERRFLDVLGNVNTYRIDDTGSLILSTPSGMTITARRTSAQTVYRCTDGTMVQASYPTTETARLTRDGRTIDMNIAVSASGARYVGGGMQWWTKGMREGMLSPLGAGETMASAPGVTCTAT
ncbi:META domain-containing protein [Pseudopontixanthobacter vadosimaris]|uniref:META domain-containing protein n=1 Tax=Pseudopontixanthobacter vadosimaris TaxID=2726450 RepID=UPI00197B92A5|nr:META domain-containing protein [Pseudopontixanthobacter vadosimaris]